MKSVVQCVICQVRTDSSARLCDCIMLHLRAILLVWQNCVSEQSLAAAYTQLVV